MTDGSSVRCHPFRAKGEDLGSSQWHSQKVGVFRTTLFLEPSRNSYDVDRVGRGRSIWILGTADGILGVVAARGTEEGGEPWEQGAGMQPRSLELSFKAELHEDHTVLTLCPPSGVHPSLLSLHHMAGLGQEKRRHVDGEPVPEPLWRGSAKCQVGTMAHRSVGLL